MRAGRGAGAARYANHLAPANVLALDHVDAREVPVEGEETVAMVDLDRLPTQAGVEMRVETAREHDGAGRRGGKGLIGEAVVIPVVPVVIEIVVPARRLCVTRRE